MDERLVIFWFRRDLRIADNTGFYYALKSGYKVLPIFIFDTNILSKLDNKQDARVQFIHNQLAELNQQFSNHGGSIRVLIGDPIEILKELVTELPVAGVYTNRDYEPYAKARDVRIESICNDHHVEFLTFKDHVIFEEGEIMTESNQPFKVYTPFKNKWLAKFNQISLSHYPSEKELNNLWRRKKYPLPDLHEVGFEKSTIEVPSLHIDRQIVEYYAEKRNFPAIHGTTKLGPHLRHGTISVRQAVLIGQKYSEIWLSELIWREFYIMILAHYPRVVDHAFKPQYDRIPWRNNEEEFIKWCNGTTGYPIVDAGMRELVYTGYMHNRVRMITASFLTKHLLIDWRWGEAFFAKHLLDFELASNNGGWQWAAGTGTDAQPYFRVFNPDSQTEKFDKQMRYIKKWIPELGTKRYPQPIVDHRFARNRAIETYKQALK